MAWRSICPMNRFALIDSLIALVPVRTSWQNFRMEPLSEIVLQCIDQRRNKARFYILSVQPTLFGEHALVRQWGRCKIELHASRNEAFEALSSLAAQKHRRGYR